MAMIDWNVHFGISPNLAIDASVANVTEMLERHHTTHAFLHSLAGLYYDPLESNNELLHKYPMPSFIDNQAHGLGVFPVCTVNPLEGLDRAKRVFSEGLDNGAKFWRLYPHEQKWNVLHPVSKKVYEWLAQQQCLLLIEALPPEVSQILDITEKKLPVVTSFHYYDSADWMLRFQDTQELFVTTQMLHGIGTIQKAVKKGFEQRILYSSNIPFASPSSSIGLIKSLQDPDIEQAIFETNSLTILERLYCDN